MLGQLLSSRKGARPQPTAELNELQVNLDSLDESSASWGDAVGVARRASAEGLVASSDLIELMRAIPRRASSRRRAVEFTREFALADPAFLQLRNEADAARDRNDWSKAEYAYWNALSLYPYFGGYRVQYAHCIKEQSRFVDASIEYYSSLALGAPGPDIRQHLEFCMGKGGLRFSRATFDAVAAYWLSGSPNHVTGFPPTRQDVHDAVELLLDRGDFSVDETLGLLNSCATFSELCCTLVQHKHFPIANRNLQRLIVEANPFGDR